MSRRWAFALVVLSGCSCEKLDRREGAQTTPAALDGSAAQAGAPEAHSSSLSKVVPLKVCSARGLTPLEAARRLRDESKFEEALSCAAQAAALNPNDPQGHAERGAALAGLERFDEAQVALSRALALDPDHPEALLGAARLFGELLPSTRERDELASLYSERGLVLAQDAEVRELIVEFSLLSAMAFNDLGQSADALERAELALSLRPSELDAQYEKAVALFELCRFEQAKASFTAMLEDPQRSSHAHHHLGLLLEREGKWKQAEKHFARARLLNPDDFPEPQLLSAAQFKEEVDRAVAALPEDMRADLGGVPVTPEDLPLDEDLLSGEPPLSPAILGLFRGPSLSEPCYPEPGAAPDAPCRSVVLYRLNLARAVKTREELIEQIRVTLLHEVGHLRGEDDFELAARGLE